MGMQHGRREKLVLRQNQALLFSREQLDLESMPYAARPMDWSDVSHVGCDGGREIWWRAYDAFLLTMFVRARPELSYDLRHSANAVATYQ
jgi:hypothetical protein